MQEKGSYKEILIEIIKTQFAKNELLEAIDDIIDEELVKPEDEMDASLIEDCVNDWYEVSGIEIPAFDVADNIAEIKKNLEMGKKKFTHFRTIFIKIAASFVIILGIAFIVNIISIKAFKINIFDNVVEFGKDIIKFDFNNNVPSNGISLVTSENDPFGLKEECKKHSMYPLLPMKMPDGTVVSNVKFEQAQGIQKSAAIIFNDKVHKISLGISVFEKDLPSNMIIPSDSQDLEKIMINDIEMYIIKEKDSYIATFHKDNTIYVFSSTMNYDDFLAVLYSFR
jgi:hypothetical protein